MSWSRRHSRLASILCIPVFGAAVLMECHLACVPNWAALCLRLHLRLHLPSPQAVVRLPFPDVEAISDFVREQLGSEECRLSEEERRRNEFAPALLLLPEGHPLAPHLMQRVGRRRSSSSSDSRSNSGSGGGGAERGAAGEAVCEAASVEGDTEAAVDEDAPDAAAGCASILSLLLPPSAAEGGDSGSQRAGQMAGVLCWPLDLAGQDTPAFAAGLLPGGADGPGVWIISKGSAGCGLGSCEPC